MTVFQVISIWIVVIVIMGLGAWVGFGIGVRWGKDLGLSINKEELEELQATFDIRWNRDKSIMERWRAARPDRALTLPDRGDLVEFIENERLALEAQSAMRAGIIEAQATVLHTKDDKIKALDERVSLLLSILSEARDDVAEVLGDMMQAKWTDSWRISEQKKFLEMIDTLLPSEVKKPTHDAFEVLESMMTPEAIERSNKKAEQLLLGIEALKVDQEAILKSHTEEQDRADKAEAEVLACYRMIEKMVDELIYIAGIAEKGTGKKTPDKTSASQAILEYVKGLEAEVLRLREALLAMKEASLNSNRGLDHALKLTENALTIAGGRG